MKEAGVYGGHENSQAVALSHDAGQRFKIIGQDARLVFLLQIIRIIHMTILDLV